MRMVPKAYTPAGNRKSPAYARAVEWISEAWDALESNLISFRVTSKNLADYSSQLRYFVRTSEFFDDLDDSMDDAGLDFANAVHDWDQETKDILDSEKDEDDNNNEL